LAVTTATRSDAPPDTSTVAEFVPGYEASAFYDLGAPRNTPAVIINSSTLALPIPRSKVGLPTWAARLFPAHPPTSASSRPVRRMAAMPALLAHFGHVTTSELDQAIGSEWVKLRKTHSEQTPLGPKTDPGIPGLPKTAAGQAGHDRPLLGLSTHTNDSLDPAVTCKTLSWSSAASFSASSRVVRPALRLSHITQPPVRS
jgi:hypothetical protein